MLVGFGGVGRYALTLAAELSATAVGAPEVCWSLSVGLLRTDARFFKGRGKVILVFGGSLGVLLLPCVDVTRRKGGSWFKSPECVFRQQLQTTGQAQEIQWGILGWNQDAESLLQLR